MRFIGNKESIVPEIQLFLAKKGLLGQNLTLFDACCGSGAVSDALKGNFNIIANDILLWSTIYTHGRIVAADCSFDKLGFDPFQYLNSNRKKIKGFFFNNYSPGGSKRMYFSSDNAGRIDYFRNKIEQWKNLGLLSSEEYVCLLATLIEAVSNVSNTAGVYGAFLKHWDPRSQKKIQFIPAFTDNKAHKNIVVLNNRIENIAEEIECDILYLDPPYTQNQYGTQYHLLETLVLNDNPQISKITGSRSTKIMRSDWSKKYKAQILFDKVIAKTKAKYIIFSYSSDGIMSKDFIEASLKRYGKTGTYECKKISYKKYRNFKTNGNEEHFEYLFFIEKKKQEDISYESPLNYTGNKANMLADIKKLVPKNIDTFIDAFGGGFNVGVNMESRQVVYNDINCFLQQMIESFRTCDTYNYLLFIDKTSKKWGLTKGASDNYLRARARYNSQPLANRDPRFLYTIILYGYQQQMRFNSSHDFNNPVGMRWFNDKIMEKMISFSRVLKEKTVSFRCNNFLESYAHADLDKKCFVYLDPPYRMTTGVYNDGKRGFEGWTCSHEEKLIDLLGKLNEKKIRFILSYVFEHKNKANKRFETLITEKKYKIVHVPKINGTKRKEVLILNYEK